MKQSKTLVTGSRRAAQRQHEQDSADTESQSRQLTRWFFLHPRCWVPVTAIGRMLGTWRVSARVYDANKVFGAKGGRVFNAQAGGGSGRRRRSWYYFAPDGRKPAEKPGNN